MIMNRFSNESTDQTARESLESAATEFGRRFHISADDIEDRRESVISTQVKNVSWGLR